MWNFDNIWNIYISKEKNYFITIAGNKVLCIIIIIHENLNIYCEKT